MLAASSSSISLFFSMKNHPNLLPTPSFRWDRLCLHSKHEVFRGILRRWPGLIGRNHHYWSKNTYQLQLKPKATRRHLIESGGSKLPFSSIMTRTKTHSSYRQHGVRTWHWKCHHHCCSPGSHWRWSGSPELSSVQRVLETWDCNHGNLFHLSYVWQQCKSGTFSYGLI